MQPEPPPRLLTTAVIIASVRSDDPLKLPPEIDQPNFAHVTIRHLQSA